MQQQKRVQAAQYKIHKLEQWFPLFSAEGNKMKQLHHLALSAVRYGASKGALDRIVLAAAEEFRDLGIAANVINPGPTDTGWMTAQQIADFTRQTPGGRPGLPDDCANLVRFLCSEEGGWINGQLLHSNGGLR